MPPKRYRSSLRFVMAGGHFVCWLWLEPVQVTAAGAKPEQLIASVPRGLCDAPFSLRLATASEGALIRYTLDGAEPTLTNGAAYSAPLWISNTTLLRAAAYSAAQAKKFHW